MGDGDETNPGDEPLAENPNYDQDFFLALAAKGKDAWNAWRRDPANKYAYVTFKGVDLSVALGDVIDFSGFDFGDAADFSWCTWADIVGTTGRARFSGATFGDRATFVGTTFGDRADFSGATFGDRATFARMHIEAWFGWFVARKWYLGWPTVGDMTGVVLEFQATFTGAIFGYKANFASAIFHSPTDFSGATFDEEATFAIATFGEQASFDGAAFGDRASFKGTVFKGHVQFGIPNKQRSSDLDLNVDEADEKVKEARIALKKRHEDSWTRFGSGPDRFLAISFGRARFDGEAVFSRRNFEGDVDFANARFYRPPDFDAAGHAARIDFSGVHIGFVRPGHLHWTCKTKVPVRLRRLRKLAEETKNHDLERDLYIEERKAERGVYLIQRFRDWVKDPKRKWALIAHLLWILVMGLYWALADYGRSFARPFVWLFASVFFFYWRYTEVLAPLMPKTGPSDTAKYERAVDMLALGNAVPFVGPLTINSEVKKFLFCPDFGRCLPIPPEGFQFWVILQNIVSITLVFFIGLALRNYFKIK